MTVRVVLADDNFLVREGLVALLAETPEVELVEAVADPEALHRAVALHRPDAVLSDIRMPPTFTTEGIDAAKRIRAQFPGTGVVVLSQYVEEDYALELLADGASSTSWCGHSRKWHAAARRSTPRWWRGCSLARPDTRSRSCRP